MSFGRRTRFSDIGLPRDPSGVRRRSGVYTGRPEDDGSYDHHYATAAIRSPSAAARANRRRESSGVYVSAAFEEMLNSPQPVNDPYSMSSPNRPRPPVQQVQRIMSPPPEKPRPSNVTPSRSRAATPPGPTLNTLIFRAFLGIATLLITFSVIYALFFKQPVHHVQHHRLYAGYQQPHTTTKDDASSSTHPSSTHPASASQSPPSSSSSSSPSVPPRSTLAQPTLIDSGDLAAFTIAKYHAYTHPTLPKPQPQQSWWSSIFSSSKTDATTEVRSLPAPPKSSPSPVFSHPDFLSVCNGRLRGLSPVARAVADAVVLNGTGIISGVCAPQVLSVGLDATNHSTSIAGAATTASTAAFASNLSVGKTASKASAASVRSADPTSTSEMTISASDFWEEVLSVWSGDGMSQQDMSAPFDKHTQRPADGADAVVVDVNSDDLDLIDDERARVILSTLTTPLNAEELRVKWANISYVFEYFGRTLTDEQQVLQMRRDADNSLLVLAQTIVREREEREKTISDGNSAASALVSVVQEVEAIVREREEWARAVVAEGEDVGQRQEDAARLRALLAKEQEHQGKILRELSTARENEKSAMQTRAQCDTEKNTEAIAAKVSQLEAEIAAVKASAATLDQQARAHAEDIVLLRRAEKDKRKEVGKRRAALRRLRGAASVDGGDDGDDQLYLTLASELGRVDVALARLAGAADSDGGSEKAETGIGAAQDKEDVDAFAWESDDEEEDENCPSLTLEKGGDGGSPSENSHPECELAQRLERLRQRRTQRLLSRRAQLQRVLRELEGEKATLKGEEEEEEEVKSQLARLRGDLEKSIHAWESVRRERENREKIREELAIRERERAQDEVDLKAALMRLMRHRAELTHSHEACVYDAERRLTETRAALQRVEVDAGRVGAEVERLQYELDLLVLSETERQARKETREKELQNKENSGMQNLCAVLVRAATSVGACEMENERLHRRVDEWHAKRVVQAERIGMWEREKSKINVVRRAIARTMG